MARLRAATFNVNSIRSRLHILERWLPGSGVDLLFLQETKVMDEEFPVEPIAALGYRACSCGEKSYNGVAVLVKNSFDREVVVSFGFDEGESDDPELHFPTRVLILRTEGLTVLNTYVPQGKDITHPDFEVKKEFLDRVREVIEREMFGPFLWVGDVNVAPTEIDVTHPENKKNHVCFCQEIRDRFAQTAEGLTDLLRVYHPEEGQYTFFDYRVKGALERNIGWRIDLAMASPSLAERALDCFVDREPRGWERPSDHTPLIADLEV